MKHLPRYSAKTVCVLTTMILCLALGALAALLVTYFFFDGSELGNPDFNAGIVFAGMLPLGLMGGFFIGAFLSVWTWHRLLPSGVLSMRGT